MQNFASDFRYIDILSVEVIAVPSTDRATGITALPSGEQTTVVTVGHNLLRLGGRRVAKPKSKT
jgi:hypothetical protein